MDKPPAGLAETRSQTLDELNEEDTAGCRFYGQGLCCAEPHWDDFHYEIQRVYERTTGQTGNWTKDHAEPWWSLGGIFGLESA